MMNTRNLTRSLSATLAAGLITIGAHAAPHEDAATHTGFLLGGGANHAALRFDGRRSIESGAGAALTAGYAFTPRWAIIGGTSGAHYDNRQSERFLLGHVDVLGRYSFWPGGGRFRPQLDFGLTNRTFRFADETTEGRWSHRWNHAAMTYGVGFDYHLTRALMLNTTMRHTAGAFRSESCGRNGGAKRCISSTRYGVGIHWYPSRSSR